MGRWMAEFFLPYFEVSIYDIADETAKVSQSLNVDTLDTLERLDGYDIILFSLPIGVSEEVMRNIAPEISGDALVVDLSSVKRGVSKVMLDHLPEGCEAVGLHPMFSPRTRSIKGQNVILVPVRGTQGLEMLKSIFDEREACTTIMDTDVHDRHMAVVQSLTHFLLIAAGETVRVLDTKIPETMRFSSPVYRIIIDMVARVLSQDRGLYWWIQKNPDAQAIRKTFLEVSKEIDNTLIEKDFAHFERLLDGIEVELGGNLDEFMERSERLVEIERE